MIAEAFSVYKNIENIVIFASGVSNSTECNTANFNREKLLLESTILGNYGKTIVYFGSCSVDDPELSHSPYVQHKIAMEKMVQKKSKEYYIFRLPQVVGNTNSPTLINFISKKILNLEKFELWKNSFRNLIDVEDVFKISNYLISNNIYKNSITNIASSSNISIFEIVNHIEEIVGIKSHYTEKDKGSCYHIDTSKILQYIDVVDVGFDNKYSENVIRKYLSYTDKGKCEKR